MFAENNQVSVKQFERMFLIEIFGTFSLTMPALLTRNAGYYGIYPLIFGSLLAGLYLLFLLLVRKKMKGNVIYFEKSFGTFGKGSIVALYWIRFLIKSAYTMVLFVSLIGSTILRGQERWKILLPMLLLCGYVAYEGIETRGRVLEMLYFVIFVPLLLTVVLSVSELSMKEWLPKGIFQWNDFFSTSYLVLLTYSPMEFLLFGSGHLDSVQGKNKKEPKETMEKAAGKGFLRASFFHVLIFLVTIGLFGVTLTKDSLWSALTIMETAKLPADFISRLDILLIAFWIFSLFGVASGYSTYGMWLVKDRWKRGKKGVLLFFFLLCSGVLALLMPDIEKTTTFYFKYLALIDFPIAVLVPFVSLLLNNRHKTSGRQQNSDTVNG